MLNEREQQVYGLVIAGKTYAEIAKELKISESSARTYWYRAKKKKGSNETEPAKKKTVKEKIQEAVDKAVAKVKAELTPPVQLKRCGSFREFSDMMTKVTVNSETLEDRVAEFKEVYCKVCIYPNRCKECPTKVLMDKYLF